MDSDRKEYLTKRAVQMERLAMATAMLYYTHPLYYAIATQLGQMDATDEISTMAVGFMPDDPTCYLFYNVDFIASISDEKLRFAVMHELLHVGLHHLVRGEGMNRKIANLAMDIIVNESHIGEYNKLKPEEQDLIVLHENPFKWTKGENGDLVRVANPDVGKMMFPCLEGLVIHETTMDEIYVRLMQNKKQAEAFESKGGVRPATHGRFTPGGKSGKIIDHGDLTEEQRAISDKILKEAFRSLGNRPPGNIPGELARTLEDFRDPVVRFPWEREITMFAQTVLKDDRERSWRRYNRRYGAASPGHVKQYRAKLMIIVDNSGSTANEYRKFMEHGVTLSKIVEEVRVVGCDTRINFDTVIKDGTVPNIKFGSSGGGTDMQDAFDYAKKLGVDGVICLTDGFMPLPDNHRIPTLFALCAKGTEVPGFRNIPLE